MLNSSLIGYTVIYNILYVFREIQNSLLKQFWNHLHFSQSINRRVIVNISECLIHIKSAVWLTISKNKIEIKNETFRNHHRNCHCINCNLIRYKNWLLLLSWKHHMLCCMLHLTLHRRCWHSSKSHWNSQSYPSRFN